MDKREFLKLSALTLVASGIPAESGEAKPVLAPSRKYNLLFFTLDDMNWSMPGFMGVNKGLTPNLDKLAARSYRFVNSRAVVPICQPSREAMMTGLVPQHSGGSGFTPVYEFVPTLTSILCEQGYFTGSIHKLGHMQPDDRFPWDYKRAGKDRSPLEYERCSREIIQQAEAAGKSFFLCCNINDPHRPFYGTEKAGKRDGNEEGPYKVPHEVGPDDVVVPPFLEDLPNIRKELAQYSNSVQRLDISIGKVLQVLKDSGHADDTIVFFSSDHGMPFPFAKASGYDSGSRTPALISWPGMGHPRTFTELVENIDYLPTLLDVLGIPQPKHVDGKSWLPLIKGEKYEKRDYSVTYLNALSSGVQYPTRTIQDYRYALIFSPWSDGKFKYVSESFWGLTFAAMEEAAKTDPKIAARVEQATVGTPYAFYDMKEDPGQRINLIDRPEHQAKIKEMQARLLTEMERTTDPQLENFQIFLAGGKPRVSQFPKIYRISDHRYEYPPDDGSKEYAAQAIMKENMALLKARQNL